MSGSVPVLVNGPTQAYFLTVTIPATTAANCLVVAVASASGASTSVTGVTLGGLADNFFRLTDLHYTGAAFNYVALWADPDCAGGPTQVVVSGLNANEVASGNGSVWVYEFSGLNAYTNTLLDLVSAGPGTGTAWDSGTTATTSSDAEAWVGVMHGPSPSTVPGAPWVNSQPAGGLCVTGYQITTAAGAADYAGTCASGDWAAAVVALNPDPAGPSGPQIYQRSGPVRARWPG